MATPLTGQVAVSQNAAGQQITAGQANLTPTVASFVAKASINNPGSVFIGKSDVTPTNGYELAPGEVFEYERNTQNSIVRYEIGPGDLYVCSAAASCMVSWLASPGNP